MGVIGKEKSRSTQGWEWRLRILRIPPLNLIVYIIMKAYLWRQRTEHLKTPFLSVWFIILNTHIYRWHVEILLYSCPGLHKCYDRTVVLIHNKAVRKGYPRSCNLWNTDVSLYAPYQFYSNCGPQTGRITITWETVRNANICWPHPQHTESESGDVAEACVLH